MATLYVVFDDVSNPQKCSWLEIGIQPHMLISHNGNYADFLRQNFKGFRWLFIADRRTGRILQHDCVTCERSIVYDEKVYNEKRELGEWKTTEETKLHYFLKEGQSPKESVSEALCKLEEKHKKDNAESIEQAGTKSKPIEFKDGEHANRHFENSQCHKQWVKSVSDEEAQSISTYTYKPFAKYLNGELRKKKSERNLNDEAKKIKRNLDNLIRRYELEDDIIVYRAMPLEFFRMINTRYWDNAYLSSSCYKDAAILKHYIDSEELACLLVLEIPAGKGRGMYFNQFSLEKDKEYEFLIKTEARFKIKSIEIEDYGILVRMRMICND